MGPAAAIHAKNIGRLGFVGTAVGAERQRWGAAAVVDV